MIPDLADGVYMSPGVNAHRLSEGRIVMFAKHPTVCIAHGRLSNPALLNVLPWPGGVISAACL